MQVPNGATIAVADGQKLKLFTNTDHRGGVKLTAVEAGAVKSVNHGSGARHHTSSANHDHGQVEKDGHAAGIADMLNAEVEAGSITHLVVVAEPKTLGELRKHFSKRLSGALVGEIAKDLANEPTGGLEKAIVAA